MWKSSKNKTSPIPGEQSTAGRGQSPCTVTSIYTQKKQNNKMYAIGSNLRTGYCISHFWTKQWRSPVSCWKARAYVIPHVQYFCHGHYNSSSMRWLGKHPDECLSERVIHFSNVAHMRMLLPGVPNGVLFPPLSSWQACRLIWTFKKPLTFRMLKHHSAARASQAINTSNVMCGYRCVRVCVPASPEAGLSVVFRASLCFAMEWERWVTHY